MLNINIYIFLIGLAVGDEGALMMNEDQLKATIQRWVSQHYSITKVQPSAMMNEDIFTSY